MPRTLVINAGSSTIKFRLYEEKDGKADFTLLAKGSASKLGSSSSPLSIQILSPSTSTLTDKTDSTTHSAAFSALMALFANKSDLFSNVTIVGHRIVHGGPKYADPLLLTREAISALDELSDLAPLHNHPSVMLVKAAIQMRELKEAQHVAVFDTHFHRTMPEFAWRYPLPYDACEESGMRKYGFHGTSHSYVATRAAAHLSKPLPKFNLITLHLGNGASACAIRNGKSVDTSMGFTPLEGLMMGTRSGDVDPSVPYHVKAFRGDDVPAVPADPDGPKITKAEDVLNHESGLKGICGESDCQKVVEMMNGDGDAEKKRRAELALDMFCYRIVKYVGAYHVAVGGADALVFTGGIGENSAEVRARVCRGLKCIGISIDEKKNSACDVSSNGTVEIGKTVQDGVKILVVATDEEGEIARIARDFLKESKGKQQ